MTSATGLPVCFLGELIQLILTGLVKTTFWVRIITMKLVATMPVMLLFFVLVCSASLAQPKAKNQGTVLIQFKNVVSGEPLVLDDSSYTNPTGEIYTVHKLKYYIGQLQFFSKTKKTVSVKKYFLINQSVDSSCNVQLPLPEGEYDSLQFLIGVDSATNTAGAQTGALDPLNDMFWTWQSGYIMEKLEGSSPQSGVINNKMEYHLGGYGGVNSTQRVVNLNFGKKPVVVQAGHKSNILIKAELNNFWLGPNKISIKETPVCSSAGALANQLSYNFAGMFSLESVTNN